MKLVIGLGSVFLALNLLVGCSGGSASSSGSGSSNDSSTQNGSTNTGTPSSSSRLSGHWQFTAASNVQSGYNTIVEVNLQQAGSNLTASGSSQIFIVAQNPSGQNIIGGNCPGNGSNSINGSLTGSTVNLTLNEGGNAFSISGTVENNGTRLTGTYQSLGGGCQDSGAFSGTLMSPLQGTYNGDLNFIDGTTDHVAATLSSSEDQMTVNAVISGADSGSITLAGTTIGGGFSADGAFQGQQIAYLAYYDTSAFAIRVFDASTAIYIGSLYSSGHEPVAQNTAFVQSASYTSQSTSSAFSAGFHNGVNRGNLIAVAFWWNNPQESCSVSISDSAGNSYHQVLKTSSIDSNDWVGCIYIAPNVNGGNNLKVTVNPGAPFQYQFSMAILEYSGVANVDVTSTTGGTSGTTITSGVAGTHYANEVLLGIAIADVNLTAGSNFNSRFTSPYFVVEDKMLPVVGSYEATFTGAQVIPYEGWDAGMITLH